MVSMGGGLSDNDEGGELLGPPRVSPGGLAVSRTFGDVQSKVAKYGGKKGVITAKPEISQFTIQPDYHDFIVMGCDGIFDKIENEGILDVIWNTVNINKGVEILGNRMPVLGNIHKLTASMTDAVLTEAAV